MAAGNDARSGSGTRKNLKAAQHYFDKACRQGHALGCGLSGLAYEKGEGVTKNYVEALSYFKEACRNGLASYYLRASDYYVYEKPGILREPKVGKKWAKDGCDQKDPASRATYDYLQIYSSDVAETVRNEASSRLKRQCDTRYT